MLIIKNTGEAEEFDPEKLKESLLRSGSTIFVADEVTKKIASKLRPGLTTETVYKRAFKELRKTSKRSAITYSLKRSIQNLGPTGFPFEEYISELLQAKGYETLVGQVLQGNCLEHEVDVVAWNEDNLILTEAKFHNQKGIKTDTRIALYVKARFDDLFNKTFKLGDSEEKREMTRGLLVTNTKFTENAKKYAKCIGTFDMISWDYPKKGNLYDIITETKLHPMTCIPSLTKHDKQELLKRGIVNCMSIKNHEEVLKEIGMSNKKISDILDNIEMLCSPEGHA